MDRSSQLLACGIRFEDFGELPSRHLSRTTGATQGGALVASQKGDDELKSLATGYLPIDCQEEMEKLIEKREINGLSGEDEERLSQLIAAGNEMTLKKSWARLILKDRGLILPIT